MIWIRRVVFYSFIALYLLVCPATIFHALGFYFKSGSRYGIVKTGLIYVSSYPSGAEIKLNGVLQEQKTPAAIRNLMPGYYQMEVKAEGYGAWSEEVPVEAERASVLEKLLLIPQKLQSSAEISGQDFNQLIKLPETQVVFVSKDGTLKQSFFWNLKRGKLISLGLEGIRDPGSRIKRGWTVAESLQMAVEVESGGKFSYFLIRPEEKAKEITSLVRVYPDQIQWSKGLEEQLIVRSNQELHFLRTDKMLVYPEVAGNIHGFGMYDRMLVALRGDHTLVNLSYDGKHEKNLMRDAYLGQTLFGEDFPYRIEIFEKNWMVFLSPKGRLITNRLPHLIAPENVLGYDVDRDHRKLVVWTQSAIGVIDFDAAQDSGEVFETGPHIVWVYHDGSDLRQVFWVYGGAHLFFLDGNQAELLDLEAFSRAKTYPLFQVKDGSMVAYTPGSGRLTYLDRDHGTLQSLDVIPGEDSFLIPFPSRSEQPLKRKILST